MTSVRFRGLGRPVPGADALFSLARGAVDSAGRTALAGLDAALASRYADEVVQHVLASRIVDRAVDQVLSGPLAEHVVERLLESEDLWLLVDEIAQSPAVTDAIGHQSVGFADQVAGQVRVRSRRADARVERAARRILHRRTDAGDAEGQ